MTQIYDNWERLVAATLKRDQIWQLCHAHSREPSVASSYSSEFSSLPSPLVTFPHGAFHEEIFVNGERLSPAELLILRSCRRPPKKLKSGHYWYDKHSGFWGKQGKMPSQIISPHLIVGGALSERASEGNTDVYVNGREITKMERRLWEVAGGQCSRDTHIWLYEDGLYQYEAHTKCKSFWDTAHFAFQTGMKLLCYLISYPFPHKPHYVSGEQSMPDRMEQNEHRHLLLIGVNGSGTNTIFNQAKVLYKDELVLEDELEHTKLLIQRNTCHYIYLLLVAREKFLEEDLNELRKHQSSNESLFTGLLASENASAVPPIYKNSLQQCAYYILKPNYKPSDTDILYAEAPSFVTSLNFSFPLPLVLPRYELTRLSIHEYGDDCKWIERFAGMELAIFCISLNDYDQFVGGDSGAPVNKMIAIQKAFESFVTRFYQTKVLLLLTKHDLFEQKIERVPLHLCEWFSDFHPIKDDGSQHLGQMAVHYISHKFKRLYAALTGRKLYVVPVNCLVKDSIDGALRYAGEILDWDKWSRSYVTDESTSSDDEPTSGLCNLTEFKKLDVALADWKPY
ncbi:guanine nucleotide-binding protein alpha-2subunit, partial [Striga asiatica]